MKFKIDYKIILPHIAAIAVFLVLAAAYLSPILSGKRLVAHDNVQSISLSHELRENYKETGNINRWTNSVFGGMPAFRIWGSQKLSEIGNVTQLFKLYLPKPMSNLFLYFLGFYIFMIAIGMKPLTAIIGSIGFALGSYNIIILEAGHSTKASTIAIMPMVFSGVYMIFKRKYLLGGLLTALFLAMAVRANHIQIGYYIMIILVFFVINEAVYLIKEKKLKHFLIGCAVLLFAGFLAVAVNASHLWTTYEYAQESIRGGRSELSENADQNKKGGLDTDYAWRWSYGIMETFSLLVPNVTGGASASSLGESSHTYETLLRNRVPANQAQRFINNLPTYHGKQPFTSGPVYLGAVIVFLFLMGAIIVPARQKYWLLILSVFTIFLCWGKNWTDFNLFFFNNLPIYNKFRVPAMSLVMTCFAMLWLAMLALREIIKMKDKDKLFKAWKIASGISGGLLLILYFYSWPCADENILWFWCRIIRIIASGMDYSSQSDAQFAANQQWIIDAIKEDRESMFKMDIFRSFAFIVLAAGVVFLYIRGKIAKTSYMLSALGVLILVDLWAVDKRYLDNDDFKDVKQYENQFQPSQADRQILKDSDPHFRVFNTTSPSGPFNDALTSYFHKSVGGYHAAKLIRYQDMIEKHLSQGNMMVFNMLNTKYFINKGPEGEPQARLNPNALGNAWFVSDHNIMKDADEEINMLNSFNPAETAIVHEKFASYLENYSYQKDPGGSIELTSYDSDHMVYKSSANTDQLAVFSEIYYNGKDWKAYIDGEFVPHIRVNYILRGLKIPAGEHTVEFKFHPKSFYTGRKIASTSFYLLIALILIGIFFEATGREIPGIAAKATKES